MGIKNLKNKKTASLSGKTIEDAKIVEPEPAPEPMGKLTMDDVIKEEPQKIVSPLLSEPVEIKAHAMGNDVPPQPAYSAPDGMKVDPDFFDTPPVAEQVQQKTAIPPKQDVPEQTFNPNADPNVLPVPEDISKKGAQDLTDTISDLYVRFIPDITYSFAGVKINTKEIKKLEQSGDLMAGAYNEVVDANKEAKKMLQARAKDDMKLIEKPLTELLKVKNVKADPTTQLIIVGIFIAISYFFLVKELKDSRDALLTKLYEKINKERRETGAVQESDIPMAETEPVV
jgi:hypothetical protein